MYVNQLARHPNSLYRTVHHNMITRFGFMESEAAGVQRVGNLGEGQLGQEDDGR